MEFFAVYYVATDSDGRCYLYSRKPKRNERLGVWKHGDADASGLCGQQMIDKAVVPYDGSNKPSWEDEPKMVHVTRERHNLLYYKYVGDKKHIREMQIALKRMGQL